MHISICLYLMLSWSLSNIAKRCAINWRGCELNFAPRWSRPRAQSISFCTFYCLEFWMGFHIEYYSSIINYQAFNPLYSSSILPPSLLPFLPSILPSFLPSILTYFLHEHIHSIIYQIHLFHHSIHFLPILQPRISCFYLEWFESRLSLTLLYTSTFYLLLIYSHFLYSILYTLLNIYVNIYITHFIFVQW